MFAKERIQLSGSREHTVGTLRVSESWGSGPSEVTWLGCGAEARTFSEEHFWGDVIWGPNQGVSQTPLVLPPRPLLQGLEPVSTAAVRHVVPEVAGLHAVLPAVTPCHPGSGARKEENEKVNFHSSTMQQTHSFERKSNPTRLLTQ